METNLQGRFYPAVKYLGFRSTQVSTRIGHLVTEPEATRTGADIENIGRRPSIHRLTNITIMRSKAEIGCLFVFVYFRWQVGRGG